MVVQTQRTWVRICVALGVMLLCWTNASQLLGWGQSPTPDLNALPPQERIRFQPSPSIEPSPAAETPADPPETVDSPAVLLPSPSPQLTLPGIVIQRLGDLHYALVKLDGYGLIEVAAEVPQEALGDSETNLPIYNRVEEIQNRLSRAISQFIRSNIDPGQLQVSNAILNDEVVLIVEYGERSSVLLTVTQADADLANMTIEDLANKWESVIQNAFIRAWEQRQPAYVQAQLKWISLVLAGNILLSLLLISIQKRSKSSWDQIQQHVQETHASIESIVANQAPDLEEDLDPVELREELSRFRRELDLTFLLRRILVLGQILQWMTGVTLILTRFPQTRDLGLHLFGLPFFIMLLLSFTLISSRVLKLLVGYFFERWLEREKTASPDSGRSSAKSQTYSLVFRDLVDYLAFFFFVIALFYGMRVPPSSLLAGAGIFGIFLSLATQSTIKDILTGVGVLIEDQYALGDWVTLNDSICGVVESLDLVYTKIRDLNGSVVTIANGQISKVENMTIDWARVSFCIDVAYQTDVDKAIELLRRESESLAADTQWKSKILNPVELIGVDRLAHDGMRLRLWIQTQAGWQWAVERELRRRVRIAFETYGISIGIPQQEIPQLRKSDLGRDAHLR